ncbi:MAG: DUF362 domain-containing protein [Phototrophicales bacterium]|nr:DUF362 domain-containing protein [Phototrophicales bacterium]
MSSKSLLAINNAKTESFVYMPPSSAFGATRILVKANLGYPKPAPITVSMPVLGAVLRGLRRASPMARIVIIEGVADAQSAERIFKQLGVMDLLDDNMRVADAESLIMQEYDNISPKPVRFMTMTAPAYISEYDCCISVGTFKRTTLKDHPLISASLKNLYGVFPREKYHGRSPNLRGQLHRPSVPEVLKDIYFSVGRYFHGGVVDLTHKLVSPDERPDTGEVIPIGQVVWGDDLLAVDEVACRLAGEPTPNYIHTIRALRDQLQEAK